MLRSFLHPIKSSISAKFLTTFIICLVIPLFLLIEIFTMRFHSILIEKEQAYTDEKINSIRLQFTRVLENMDKITSSLVLNDSVLDIMGNTSGIPTYDWFTGYTRMINSLSSLSAYADYQYGITVLTQDGRVYQCGANYNGLLKMTDPLALDIKNENGRTVVLKRKADAEGDKNVLTQGRAIYGGGHFLGLILVDVPISHFVDIFSPFDAPGTQFYILQKDRKVLYSSEDQNRATIDGALNSALQEQSATVTLGGTDYLLQEKNLMHDGIFVVTLVNSGSIFKDSESAWSEFVAGSVLVLIITLAGVLLMTYFFTKDIRSLNREVSLFGHENISEIRLSPRSPDEVGQLMEGVTAMSQRINRLLLQMKESERNKRLLEFQALQAQVNPHMIYNTLNTISYLAEIQNVSNIHEVSSSFAFLLRSISNSPGEFITVRQEVEYLRAFIAIKKYNLLYEVDVRFDIDENALNCRILKLLLQPIVENAFVHGFTESVSDALLTVQIRLEGGCLKAEIRDNGVGMDAETVAAVRSGSQPAKNSFLRVGIHNITERLALQYGEQTSFRIESVPGSGTAVFLSFPAETA